MPCHCCGCKSRVRPRKRASSVDTRARSVASCGTTPGDAIGADTWRRVNRPLPTSPCAGRAKTRRAVRGSAMIAGRLGAARQLQPNTKCWVVNVVHHCVQRRKRGLLSHTSSRARQPIAMPLRSTSTTDCRPEVPNASRHSTSAEFPAYCSMRRVGSTLQSLRKRLVVACIRYPHVHWTSRC